MIAMAERKQYPSDLLAAAFLVLEEKTLNLLEVMGKNEPGAL